MRLGNIFANHKLIILASGASIAFHVLWISIVRIDYGNGQTGSRANLAKVSFVGPVYTRPVMNLNLKPVQAGMPEERYFGTIGRKMAGTISGEEARSARDGLYGASAAQNPVITKMAVDALSREKEMPGSEGGPAGSLTL